MPVSPVERSKEFYQRLGWRLDDDVAPTNDVRIVQFTPSGSGCSVTFGKGITAAAPGSAVVALIVSDIKAAHDEVVRRGVAASGMWDGAPLPVEARLPGPDPKRTSYGSFFAFNDPATAMGHNAAPRPTLMRRENCMNKKDVAAAAASSSESHINRRDGLKLVRRGWQQRCCRTRLEQRHLANRYSPHTLRESP